MATRRTNPQGPQRAELSIDDMRKGIIRLERLIGDVEAFEVSQMQKRFGPEVEALGTRIEGVLESVFGHNTVEGNRYRAACRLDSGPVRMRSDWLEARGGYAHDELAEARQFVTEGKTQSVSLLREAVTWLREELENAGPESMAVESSKTPAPLSKNVFIVHGHDGEAKQAVARFIEAQGLKAIILHEQASGGMRTVIEKVEAYGADAGFAIVLFTPDDEGRAVDGALRPRARQNVILEVGYLMGKLGRGKVCVLATTRDMELPSDLGGVVTETFDAMGHGWKASLGKEMEAAGFPIDWAKAMR